MIDERELGVTRNGKFYPNPSLTLDDYSTPEYAEYSKRMVNTPADEGFGLLVDALAEDALVGSFSLVGVTSSFDSGEAYATIDDYKASPEYDTNVEYYEGLTVSKARYMQEQNLRDNNIRLLIRDASAVEIGASFIGSIAVGIVEPGNLVAGVAASVIMSVGKNALRAAKLMKEAVGAENVISRGAAVANAVKYSAAEGVLATAITEPIFMMTAEETQREYGWEDSAFNLATSVGLSAAITGVGTHLRLKSFEREKIARDAAEMMAFFLERGQSVSFSSVSTVQRADLLGTLQAERQTLSAEMDAIKSKMSDAEAIAASRREAALELEMTQIPAAKYGLHQDGFDVPLSDIVSALDAVRIGAGKVVNREIAAMLKSLGGVQPSPELTAAGATAKSYPGLISNEGMLPDRAREALSQRGMLQEDSSVADMFDALNAEFTPPSKRMNQEAVRDAEAFLSEHGVNPVDAIERYKAAASDEVKELRKELKLLKKGAAESSPLDPVRAEMKRVDAAMAHLDVKEADVVKSLNEMLTAKDFTAPTHNQVSLIKQKLDGYRDYKQILSEYEQVITDIPDELRPREFVDIEAKAARQEQMMEAMVACVAGV